MATSSTAERNAFIALGAIFGVAAGIGAGMLIAPRSGEETRRQIKEKADLAQRRARTQLTATRDKAADKLSHTLDRSKDMIDKAADKAKTAADRTANRAKDAADMAKAETSVRSRSTTNR